MLSGVRNILRCISVIGNSHCGRYFVFASLQRIISFVITSISTDVTTVLTITVEVNCTGLVKFSFKCFKTCFAEKAIAGKIVCFLECLDAGNGLITVLAICRSTIKPHGV